MNRVVERCLAGMALVLLATFASGDSSSTFPGPSPDGGALTSDDQTAIQLVRTIDVPDADAAQIRRILLLGSPLTECLTNLFYYSFAVSNKSDRTTLQVEIHRPFLPGLFTTTHFLENGNWTSCKLPPYPEFFDGLTARHFIRSWLETEDDWLNANTPTVPSKLVDLLVGPELDFQANYYQTGWKWLSVPPMAERRFSVLAVPVYWPSPILFQFGCRRIETPIDHMESDYAPSPQTILFSPLVDGKRAIRFASPEEQRAILASSRARTLWQVYRDHDWRHDLELLQEWKHETESTEPLMKPPYDPFHRQRSRALNESTDAKTDSSEAISFSP